MTTPRHPSADPEDEIRELVELLGTTERRIEELTGGEVDAVADSEGRTFLLGRAQERQRESEATKQAAILNALPAHIALLDTEGLIVSVNESWRRFSDDAGQGPRRGVGVNYLEVCDRACGADASEAPLVAKGIREVLSGAALVFRIVYPCHSPAAQRWFQLTATPVGVDRSAGAVVLHLDITEQVLAREEYRLIFDSSPHPMGVIDGETLAFLAVNDASVELYGYSRDEFLAMTIMDIRRPEEVPALLQRLALLQHATGRVTSLVRHRKKDGTIFDVEGSSNPVEFRGRRAYLALAHDVTEKKHLEAQLRQAQKMEAVGRLAGGVAHDFNNALGVILGYTELLLRQVNEAQRGKLEQILKATQRASGLTRQLLAFSRKQVVDPKVLDVNALLEDLETMLGRLIGEHIQLVMAAGANLGRVKADPGQLEQVVMNLCVNARDAMPNGGALRVETANVDMDAAACARHVPMEPRRYVALTVTDTGSGIEREILSKIFEPFFTTKQQDKGTGLGLAMVYGMVKQAGGYIWVDSEVGRGTTFAIYLPRVDELTTPAALRAAMPATGSETILLVEDEAPLREIAREVLEEHGYRVIEAAGPHKAIEICHRHPETIDLLVTDVVMPEMNGRALAEALVAARPGLRVLYMSGYTDDVIAHSGVLESGTLLLEKPFTVQALLERVRTAIGTPAAVPRIVLGNS